MEKKNTLIGNLMLLIAALVWGCAFVAQSEGMKYVEPLTFNGIRMLLGGLSLLPVIAVKDRLEKRRGTYTPPAGESRRVQWIAGLLCGLALTVASTLQQFGLMEAAPGKAGFLTALYIVLVPLCRFLFGNKISPTVWGGVALAVGGIYFLCVTADGSAFGRGEVLVLLCAVFFACHILLVDAFSPRVDGVRLSCMQFFVTGIICTAAAFLFETPNLEGLLAAKVEILYAGIGSSGIAYTLQILGQQRTKPTVASLLMSFESVFAVLAAIVLAGDVPSGREILGCVLMFTAVILAQMEWKGIGKGKRKSA